MTIEDPDMKPIPGVRKPAGTANYHYQKKVPKDLLMHPSINGELWGFRGSLGTSNLREANALAAAKLAELEKFWATLSASQRASRPGEVTPALLDAIAQRVKAAVLAEDEALRADHRALAASLMNWWRAKEKARHLAHAKALRDAQSSDQEPPPYRSLTVPKVLTAEGLEELEQLKPLGMADVMVGELLDMLKERHQAAAEETRKALGRGLNMPILVRADREARALGVNLSDEDWKSTEAKSLREACQRAYLEALEGLAQRDNGMVVDTPPAPSVVPSASEVAPQASEGLTLGEVVKEVLKAYPENDYKRKLNMVTGLMLQVISPTLPVKDLKQAQVTAFLSKVCKLPTDWYTQTRKGAKVSQLLDQEHPECIGPKTFESTYRAALSTFLTRAQHEYQDQGFPATVSVRFAKYQGTREENEDQQRNFKPDELQRLFGSKEYAEFAQAPDMAHRYWLPLLMLHSGARPRELCQINPQVDYGTRDGVPFFLISEKTEADAGVDKTVKTGEERHIPIHPRLIEWGFLEYVDKVKGQGAKRLFPGFGMNKGNAAARAGYWFSDFLEEIGLRDENPKALISGLYAFKKTFITEAHRLGLRYQSITGHADESASKVLRSSYIMEEIPIADKLQVLKQVDFGVNPPSLGYK